MRKMITRRKHERGQAFLELAISVVFLLVLLSAMIDLGWAFYTIIAMRDAAQEAAVYASMCPSTVARPHGAKWQLFVDRLHKSASAPLDINDIPDDNVHLLACIVDPSVAGQTCDPDPTLAPTLGYAIRVELQVDHQIRTPFVGGFIGTETYPLRVNVSDLILRVHDADCK